MKFLSLFLLPLIIFVSCSNQKIIFPYYSNSTIDQNDIERLYQEVTAYEGIDLFHFIEKVESLENTEKLNESNLTGLIGSKVIINEHGSIDVIIITESINPYTDSLTFEAINRSKFKPLNEDNENVRYSISIHYFIKDGSPSKTFVNGVSSEIPFNPLIKTMSDITTNEEYFIRKNFRYSNFAYSPELAGEVKLRVLVNTIGEVDYAKVISSTNRLLSDVVEEIAYKWEFIPISIENEPIDALITVMFINPD